MERQMKLSEDTRVEIHADAPVQLWASRSHTDVVLQVIKPSCILRNSKL